MKKLSILGSTGSIGTSTLDVVRHYPDKFQVIGLAAGRNVKLLSEQVREFSPEIVSVPDLKLKQALQERLGDKHKTIILRGEEGLKTAATLPESDQMVIAISGSRGLLPTYWAITSGHDVALANKESMVMAGRIITESAKNKGVIILPIDSEHSAIFQCLLGRKKGEVSKIILTASGGPFRDFTLDQMRFLTPEMALNHPVWKMGKKVTIDSSTMMNKGLEIIEARWLFDFLPKQIEVLVHPESIIHSMVEFRDRSIIALLSVPDMRIPITKALSHPDTWPSPFQGLDLGAIGSLSFYNPDQRRFPCLRLAYQAINGEESLPVVLNAANEMAVEAFFQKQITYLDIPSIIERCLEGHKPKLISTIEDALFVDGWAKDCALRIIKGVKG